MLNASLLEDLSAKLVGASAGTWPAVVTKPPNPSELLRVDLLGRVETAAQCAQGLLVTTGPTAHKMSVHERRLVAECSLFGRSLKATGRWLLLQSGLVRICIVLIWVTGDRD